VRTTHRKVYNGWVGAKAPALPFSNHIHRPYGGFHKSQSQDRRDK